MKTFVISMFFVFAPFINAQALEPCDTMSSHDYYQRVDNIIDEAVNVHPQLSITFIPSFSHEWGIRISGGKLYLVYFDSSLWYKSHSTDPLGYVQLDFSSTRIKTSVHHVTLEQETIRRLMKIYGEAVTHTHKTEEIGLDGVIYRFSVDDAGCGQTWSPELSSVDGHLVQTITLLAQYARSTTQSDIERNTESLLTLLDQLEH